MNAKNNFIRAGRSPGSGRFRTGSGARCEFIAGANSFKCNAGYRSGRRSVARASAIPHGDSESVATTSERSAGCVGEGEPHRRVGASTKSRAISHCRRRGISRACGECTATVSNRGHVSCLIDYCAGSVVCPGVSASPFPASGSFPTTDTSVVTSTPETISSTGAGASLTQPITIGGSKAYMNISLDSMFALAYSSATDLNHIEVGDHDPQQRGFNARNTELAFDGAVDPYFQGFANIVFLLNNDNETEVELEEAFLQTTSLPYNLQLKGGQFLAAFGRLNPTHPHTWDFADTPLVNGLFLGPDGLRGVGAQASWTLPLPWYSQLVFASQNGRGESGFSFRNPGDNGMFFDRITTDREVRGLQDFAWIPRFENSFNLTDTQTVLAGVSGAFGSNETGADSRTQIYGADLLYKWKSSHAEGGFPFVKWQTEFMYRRFQAGHGADDSFPVAETFHDWGLYSQVLWGFKKGWTAGIRGDYVHMQDSMFTDDLDRQSRWRLSADLTWYPTEFSKIRLQYNQDFLEENFFLSAREVESVFLQWEFILGSHGAHKF